MKNLYKLISFFICIALICTAIPITHSITANAATNGYYTYTVSNGKATITDCNTSISGSITIPSTLGGYPVSSIGKNAFYSCESITSITIPNCVTTIEDYAFAYCNAMLNITIPNSVTKIGSYAFYFCESIIEVIVPNSVIDLGEYVFAYSNIQKITLPNSISVIKTHSFYSCNQLKDISIPNSIRIIGDSAFSFCDFENITIPNSVTTIADSTFSHCSNLISAEIPTSVTDIGHNAFAYCTSLKNITIPYNVSYIGIAPFAECYSLENIDVDTKNPFFCSQDGILFNKSKTQIICYPSGKCGSEYTIPAGVKNIESYAFYYCSSLTSINISETVTDIGTRAFNNCYNLTDINLPYSLKSLGAAAFMGCHNLYEITIPNTLDFIDHRMFARCYSLTDITIPGNIKTIKIHSFRGCYMLTNVILCEGVTDINFSAFSDCENLSKIIIPQSVTNIDKNAFSGCNSLTIYGYIGSYAESYAKENDMPFRSIGNSQTDSYEKIAREYPQYLKNADISNEILTVYQDCAKVIDYYSQDSIARLCALDAIANGSKIVTKHLLSLVGGETAQQTWEKETATMLVQKLQGDSNTINDIWDDVKKANDYSELALTASQTNKKVHLVNYVASNHPNITYDSAENIVNTALERTSFQSINDFSTASEFVVDCMDVIIFAFELYDIQMALVERLMESVPTDTSLYEGLSLLKQDLEKEPEKYISEKILTDTVVYKIIDVLTEKAITCVASASGATTVTPVALIDLMVDIFYTVFIPCNIDDLNRTIIAYDYALTINTELLNLQNQMIICKASKDTLSQDIIEDYRFLWQSYVAGLRCYLEMAIASDKYFTMRQSLKNKEQTLDTKINFDKYINCCLNELLSDINSQKIKCGHIFAYKTDTSVTTCTNDSYYMYYCPTCAVSFEEINTADPADGHTFVSKTVVPTCETAGYTLYHCKNCGVSHYSNHKPATGHNYTSTTVAPTCYKGGYTLHTCTNCSHQYIDYRTHATTHNFIESQTIAPTCVEMGYTLYSCNNGCNVTKKAFYTQITEHIFTDSVCSCGLRGGEFNEIKWTLDTQGIMEIQGNGTIESELQTDIPWASFCSEIFNVKISDGISAIGNYVFLNCDSLQFITIPYSVKTISKNAFENCDNLTIVCHYASVAKTFAVENKINYSLTRVLCDASGDGKLNSEDLTSLRKFLLNGYDISPDGDCNEDTLIDVRDLIRLKKNLSHN